MFWLIIGFLVFGAASISMIVAIANGSLHPAMIIVVVIFGIIPSIFCLLCAIGTNKANTDNKNKEKVYPINYSFNPLNHDNDLENILEIFENSFFYKGMSRRDVVDIFAEKGIQPVWVDKEVVAYLIPNATFIKNGNNMTYIGKGTDSYVWAFQFDQFDRLVQQGVMPSEE